LHLWSQRRVAGADVITFVLEQRKFEVEGCRCSDAQKYHLEFDSDLKLIAKRLVR
jgi:hypothetical protein